VAVIRAHEFISLDGVIDTPSWTFDYGLDPKMGEAIGRCMGSIQGTVRERQRDFGLDVTRTDLVRYSLGAGVALQVAIRHPSRVRRLAGMPATYRSDGRRLVTLR
jgi:predicted esterase